MLSFDGQPHGVILVHTVLIPESLEEIEAEVATKRLLDDLAVPLSLTSGPHSDPAEYVFVKSYCRSHFAHLCIIAYRCLRAERASDRALPSVDWTGPLQFGCRRYGNRKAIGSERG